MEYPNIKNAFTLTLALTLCFIANISVRASPVKYTPDSITVCWGKYGLKLSLAEYRVESVNDTEDIFFYIYPAQDSGNLFIACSSSMTSYTLEDKRTDTLLKTVDTVGITDHGGIVKGKNWYWRTIRCHGFVAYYNVPLRQWGKAEELFNKVKEQLIATYDTGPASKRNNGHKRKRKWHFH